MYALSLKNDGAIYYNQSAVDSEVLKYLSYQIGLEDKYTLRSFFEMIGKYELLGKLNSFLHTCIEQYQTCTEQGCESDIIGHLEFSKTVEMIGVPEKRLEIYSSIRGVRKSDRVEIRSLQLNSLLDMPLRLGRLKHVVFGDRVNAVSNSKMSTRSPKTTCLSLPSFKGMSSRLFNCNDLISTRSLLRTP